MENINLNKRAIRNKLEFNAYLSDMLKLGVNNYDATYLFINLYKSDIGELSLTLTKLIRLDSGHLNQFDNDRNDNIRFLNNNNIKNSMQSLSFETMKNIICHLFKNEYIDFCNNSFDFHVSFIKNNDELFYDNSEEKNIMLSFLYNINKEISKKENLRNYYYNMRGVYA